MRVVCGGWGGWTVGFWRGWEEERVAAIEVAGRGFEVVGDA